MMSAAHDIAPRTFSHRHPPGSRDIGVPIERRGGQMLTRIPGVKRHRESPDRHDLESVHPWEIALRSRELQVALRDTRGSAHRTQRRAPVVVGKFCS
jgi:hypothetical protein